MSTAVTLEQMCRDLLEVAIEERIVSPNADWTDPHPQARSAGELCGVANLLSERLSESEFGRYAAFGRKMLDELKHTIVAGDCDMDTETLAENAVKCGLMEYVPYDPTIHGDDIRVEYECETGEMIYYWG